MKEGSKVSVVADELKDDHCGIDDHNYVKVEFAAKDQRKGALAPVTIKLELDETIKSIDGTAYKGETGFAQLFTTADGLRFDPVIEKFTDEDTGILKPGKKITVRVKATAYYTCDDDEEMEKVSKFSFQIKNIEGVKAETPELKVTDKVDVNLGNCRVDVTKGEVDTYNHASRTGKIELVQEDREDFFIRNVAFDAVNLNNDSDVAAKAEGDGEYTVVITKGDYAIDGTADSKKVKVTPEVKTTDCSCTTPGTIKVTVEMCKPDDTDANKIVTADTGSYKVRLYKGNGVGKKPTLVTTKYIKVSDTGDALKTEKVREYITEFDTIEELSKALKFTYNGVEVKYDKDNEAGLYLIDDFNPTIDVEYDYKTDDTSRVYIYSINVNVPIKTYNKGWNDAEYTEMEIIVDKTFTLYKD